MANATTPVIQINEGKVGIGTTNPGATLELNSDTGNAAKLKIGRQNTATNYLELGTSGGSSVINAIGISGVNASLIFNRSTTTATTQSMIIDGDGNVGIGLTNPSEKLTVASPSGFIATFQSTTATDFRPIRWLNSTGQNVGFLGNNGTTNEFFLIAQDRPLIFGTGTDGAERVRITSAGTLLLRSGAFPTNQDSPFLYRIGGGSLAIGSATETGSGAHVALYTNSLERMRIDSSGLVGINVTSPQTRLQTNLGITGSYLGYLNGTASTFDMSANVAVVHNSPAIGNGTGAGLVLANNDKSNGAPSPIIAFSAKSASNSYNHTYAAIYGVRTATGADTNWTKGDIVLATGAGTGPNEIMRVTSAGNVGIGEVGPSSKLVVRKDNAGGRGGEISIVNYATNTVGNEAALNFGLESSTYDADLGNAQIKARVMATNAASDMIFSTWNGTSFGERMRIASGGNIGISETSPFGKLHIKTSDTGVTSASAQGNLLVLEDSENGLSILSSTAGAGYINFGDSDDNDIGMIIYGHSSNSMDFWTNAGKRMTIDSSGSTILQDGVTYTTNAPTHRGVLIISGPSAPTNFGGIEFHTNSGGGAGYGTKIYSSDATWGVATRNNDAAFTTRFEISGSTGNAYFVGSLGVGVTGPSFKTHIRGGSNTEEIVLKLDKSSYADTGGHTTILGLGTEPGGWAKGGIGFERTGSYDRGKIHFLQENTSNTDAVTLSDSVVTIQPDGKVGIGTTSPDEKLDITGGYLKFNGGDYGIKGSASLTYNAVSDHYFMSSGSTQVTIKASGDVGIGETSPDQKLNVREDGGSDVFRGIEVHNNNQSDARAGICFKAYDWVQSAIWHGRTGTAAYAGALVLGTNPNTTDLTVSGVTGRMYILNNGNVGIGDNSPDYRLAVKKVNAATPAIMVSGAHYGGPRIQTYGLDADANAWMGLGTDMSGAAYEHSIYFSDYNGNGRLTMGTYNGTTYSTKMVILRNGNVGIANTSPDKLLHVGDGLATLSAPQGAEIEGYNNTLDVKTNEGNNISDFTPAINLFCDGVTGSSGTGTGIYFRAKTGGGGGGEYTKGRIQGAVYTSWTTNTDATRTSKLVNTNN